MLTTGIKRSAVQERESIMTKSKLRRLVSDTTVDVYEALAPQLGKSLADIQSRTDLTEEQKSDEVLLDIMGYIKSCTNEILIQVLSEILDLQEEDTPPQKLRP